MELLFMGRGIFVGIRPKVRSDVVFPSQIPLFEKRGWLDHRPRVSFGGWLVGWQDPYSHIAM